MTVSLFGVGAVYFVGELTLALFLCCICIFIYRLYNHEDGTRFTFWGLDNVEDPFPFDNLDSVVSEEDLV